MGVSRVHKTKPDLLPVLTVLQLICSEFCFLFGSNHPRLFYMVEFKNTGYCPRVSKIGILHYHFSRNEHWQKLFYEIAVLQLGLRSLKCICWRGSIYESQYYPAIWWKANFIVICVGNPTAKFFYFQLMVLPEHFATTKCMFRVINKRLVNWCTDCCSEFALKVILF